MYLYLLFFKNESRIKLGVTSYPHRRPDQLDPDSDRFDMWRSMFWYLKNWRIVKATEHLLKNMFRAYMSLPETSLRSGNSEVFDADISTDVINFMKPLQKCPGFSVVSPDRINPKWENPEVITRRYIKMAESISKKFSEESKEGFYSPGLPVEQIDWKNMDSKRYADPFVPFAISYIADSKKLGGETIYRRDTMTYSSSDTFTTDSYWDWEVK